MLRQTGPQYLELSSLLLALLVLPRNARLPFKYLLNPQAIALSQTALRFIKAGIQETFMYDSTPKP